MKFLTVETPRERNILIAIGILTVVALTLFVNETFKPIISSSMNEVGVTRSYKEMMDKYTSLPFMKSESLDLDHYVTDKSLDGLFYMLGQEEKKIRTNPAGRVTELLKKVFGE